MQFSITALVLAAGASASYAVGNVTYTTEVVTSYETYCPGPTTLTYGTQTYTVTEPTTLTITDCPVTIEYPVYTTSSVICHACTSAPAPVYPTTSYPNTTVATTTYYPTTTLPTTYPTSIPTAAAGKIVAGMAGVLAAVAAAL